MFMKKRSLSLVYGLNIVLILAMISTTVTNAALFYFNDLIIMTCMTVWFICWWLLLYFLTVKNWMIYFKYKWTFYTLQSKWQQLLNRKIVTELQDKNWYIHNNHKYGNLKFIYKLFGAIYFSAFSTSSVAVLLMSNPNASTKIKLIAACMQVTAVLPAIAGYFILVCKTPFIKDTFHIHWESKMHSRILMIMGFICVATNSLAVLTGSDSVIALGGGPTLVISFFAINFISTFGIVSKNTRKEDNDNTDSAKSKGHQQIQLDMVLKDKNSINAFMHHLSREYVVFCPVYTKSD